MRKCATARFLASAILSVTVIMFGGYAQADTELKFEKAILYGSAGDQAANAIKATEESLYVAGIDLSSNLVSLALRYAVPPADVPLENFKWSDAQTGASSISTIFSGLAVTSEGVYFAGHSSATMSGKKKTTQLAGVLAKFSPASLSSGTPLWVVHPGFFPASNEEALRAVAVDQEQGAPMIYVTGYASNAGDNMTAMLAKYDANGALLWSQALGDENVMKKSSGTAVAVLNGFVYVAGFTNADGVSGDIKFDGLPLVAAVWKYDSTGAQIWTRKASAALFSYDKSDDVTQGIKVDLVASGGHVYLSASKNDGTDVSLLKYDQNGELIWENGWAAESNSGEDAKHGWALGIAEGDDRLYVSGFMEHKGPSKDEDIFILEVDKNYGSVLAAHVYGEAGQLENAFGIAATKTDVYVAGAKNSSDTGDKKKMVSDASVALLRYSVLPVSTVEIDIESGALQTTLNQEADKEISVAIISTEEFNAPASVKMNSLRFGRTGNEACWSGCSTKDVNGDGASDLLCYFKISWTPWTDSKPIFEAGDAEGILKGQTIAGARFMGKDSLAAAEIPPPVEPEPTPDPEVPPVPASEPAPPLTSGPEPTAEESEPSTPSVEPEPAPQTSDTSTTPTVEEPVVPQTSDSTVVPLTTDATPSVSTSTSSTSTPTTSPAKKVMFIPQVLPGATAPVVATSSASTPVPAPQIESSPDPVLTQNAPAFFSPERILSSEPSKTKIEEPLTEDEGPGTGLARAYYDLGRIAFKQGNLSEAFDYYTEALQIDPNAPEIHTDLGVILIQQGKLEEAAAHFAEALKLNPNDAIAREKLDFIAAKIGQVKA